MRNFCNKRIAIGIVAVIDMIFAAVLFSLYLRKFMFFYVPQFTLTEFSPPSLRLFLLLPVTLNGFQFLIGYHLLMSTRKNNTFRSLAKATMWFQTSIIILTFLCFKLFLMLLLFSNKNYDSWPMTITIWEILFKLFSIYLVREFIEHLKSIVYNVPNVHFYSVFVPSNAPSPSPTPTINIFSQTNEEPNSPFNPNSGPQNTVNYPIYINRLSTAASATSNPVFV